MSLTLLVAPATEPLTLAEAKAHLRVDASEEEAFIASLVTTARLQVEAALGLALVSQQWRVTLDRWPGAGWSIELPLRPVAAIAAVRLFDADGVAATLSPEAYVLDPQAGVLAAATTPLPQPGRRRRGIEIDITAGFGAMGADAPAPIRQALLMLVAHWFEYREPAVFGSTATRIPDAVCELLAPWRKVAL